MERNVIKVSIDTDQEKVARTVSRYDLMAIPVVDEKDRLVGIVTFDDVLDVLEEETTEDIYRMAGTGGEDAEEEFASSVWGKVRKRLPWLVILLFGDMISASVIKGFSNTLEMVVALAYFVPVLTDMGGNVGTQSFAIVVRGLATGELENKEIWRDGMERISSRLTGWRYLWLVSGGGSLYMARHTASRRYCRRFPWR